MRGEHKGHRKPLKEQAQYREDPHHEEEPYGQATLMLKLGNRSAWNNVGNSSELQRSKVTWGEPGLCGVWHQENWYICMRRMCYFLFLFDLFEQYDQSSLLSTSPEEATNEHDKDSCSEIHDESYPQEVAIEQLHQKQEGPQVDEDTKDFVNGVHDSKEEGHYGNAHCEEQLQYGEAEGEGNEHSAEHPEDNIMGHGND